MIAADKTLFGFPRNIEDADEKVVNFVISFSCLTWKILRRTSPKVCVFKYIHVWYLRIMEISRELDRRILSVQLLNIPAATSLIAFPRTYSMYMIS